MTVTSFAQNRPISVASCLLSILVTIKHRGSSATLPEVSSATLPEVNHYEPNFLILLLTEVSFIIEDIRTIEKRPKMCKVNGKQHITI